MGRRGWLRGLLSGQGLEDFATDTRVFDLLLPSNFNLASSQHGKELPFRAKIAVCWRLPVKTEVCRDTFVMVGDQLADFAAKITGSFSLLHREEAESALNVGLCRIPVHPAPYSVQATLAVESEDVEFAREQRTRELEVMRQRAEVERLLILRDTVLCDAPTARLWWLGTDRHRLVELAKHDDDIAQAVALVASVEGENASRPDEAVIAKIVDQFLAELDVGSRWLLLQQLGMVFRNYDREDLATQLSAATIDNAPLSRPGNSEANGISPINGLT